MQIDWTPGPYALGLAFMIGFEVGRWWEGRKDRPSTPQPGDAFRTPWMPQGGFVTDPNMMRHFEIKIDDDHQMADGPESAPEGSSGADDGQAHQ